MPHLQKLELPQKPLSLWFGPHLIFGPETWFYMWHLLQGPGICFFFKFWRVSGRKILCPTEAKRSAGKTWPHSEGSSVGGRSGKNISSPAMEEPSAWDWAAGDDTAWTLNFISQRQDNMIMDSISFWFSFVPSISGITYEKLWWALWVRVRQQRRMGFHLGSEWPWVAAKILLGKMPQECKGVTLEQEGIWQAELHTSVLVGIRKNPGWMDKEDVMHTHTHTHTHTQEYNSAIKRWNLASFDNIDGTWGYYAKWYKSDGEKNTIWFHSYV